MNLRITTMLWMGLVLVAAFGLYMVKYRVQALQEDIAMTRHQLDEERQALHVLKAEWAYLNRPDRLQELSDKYLKAEPMTGEQMIDLATVPYPAVPEDESSALIPASAGGTTQP